MTPTVHQLTAPAFNKLLATMLGYDVLLNIGKTEDACWEWMSKVTPQGYGMVGRRSPFSGRQAGAHVIAWELAHGRAVPKGRCVCHTCDNRRCVRPSHLFDGAYRDNFRDMLSKGKGPKVGKRGPLTPEEFWAKVKKGSGARCWLWTGTRGAGGWGYVRLHVSASGRTAHHYAWHLSGRAPVPTKHYLAQACGEKLCVRPDHMEIRLQR